MLIIDEKELNKLEEDNFKLDKGEYRDGYDDALEDIKKISKEVKHSEAILKELRSK